MAGPKQPDIPGHWARQNRRVQGTAQRCASGRLQPAESVLLGVHLAPSVRVPHMCQYQWELAAHDPALLTTSSAFISSLQPKDQCETYLCTLATRAIHAARCSTYAVHGKYSICADRYTRHPVLSVVGTKGPGQPRLPAAAAPRRAQHAVAVLLTVGFKILPGSWRLLRFCDTVATHVHSASCSVCIQRGA